MDHILAYGVAVVLGLVLVYGMSMSIGRKLPPGPFPWPVVGNLFLGGDYPHQKFAQLAKERYGNIMNLFFGSVRVVIVSDAKTAKELFSVSDAKFASRPIHDLMYTTSKYLNFGEKDVSMSMSTYSPRVRDVRQLCMTELFSAQKMEMIKSTRTEEIRRTVAKLKELAGHPPVEIRSVVSELSLRIFCRAVFNKAFMHSERFSSTEGSLHPLAIGRLEMEISKLLGTYNLADVIPIFRLLFGKFDVQGINARWKNVNMLRERCSTSVLEWYREHAPNGSVPAEESTTDFVETLLRLTDSGQYTVTEIKSLIMVRLLNNFHL